MSNDQQIRVSVQTWKDLSGRKEPGDSFNAVIQRLLEQEPNTQAVRNALDDLQTAADKLEGVHDFDADMIEESTATLRDELGVGQDV